MKKSIILSLIALSSVAANAQTDVKADAAAAKQAAKELKAKQAADLKAFKEKQKADLAAFITKQKDAASGVKSAVALESKGDSVAHIYGTALSRGLKEYACAQLGVDSTKIAEFAQGILDNIGADNTDPAKKSYNAGYAIGADIIGKTESFSKEYYAADPDKSINAKIVGEALVDAILGQADIEPTKAGEQLQTIMQQRKTENEEKLYGPLREEGKNFLEANKYKAGVVVLPSGLQYKVLTEGTGEKPTASDKVKVNYEGRLLDGTVFDSSYKRNQPATFGVTQVIKGWTEALQLMPVGSKWELYIPYQLAYGERGAGNDIKPYSTLVFTVELLSIEPKPEAKAPATATDKKDDAKKTTKNTAKKK